MRWWGGSEGWRDRVQPPNKAQSRDGPPSTRCTPSEERRRAHAAGRQPAPSEGKEVCILRLRAVPASDHILFLIPVRRVPTSNTSLSASGASTKSCSRKPAGSCFCMDAPSACCSRSAEPGVHMLSPKMCPKYLLELWFCSSTQPSCTVHMAGVTQFGPGATSWQHECSCCAETPWQSSEMAPLGRHVHGLNLPKFSSAARTSSHGRRRHASETKYFWEDALAFSYPARHTSPSMRLMVAGCLASQMLLQLVLIGPSGMCQLPKPVFWHRRDE